MGNTLTLLSGGGTDAVSRSENGGQFLLLARGLFPLPRSADPPMLPHPHVDRLHPDIAVPRTTLPTRLSSTVGRTPTRSPWNALLILHSRPRNENQPSFCTFRSTSVGLNSSSGSCSGNERPLGSYRLPRYRQVQCLIAGRSWFRSHAIRRTALGYSCDRETRDLEEPLPPVSR